MLGGVGASWFYSNTAARVADVLMNIKITCILIVI